MRKEAGLNQGAVLRTAAADSDDAGSAPPAAANGGRRPKSAAPAKQVVIAASRLSELAAEKYELAAAEERILAPFFSVCRQTSSCGFLPSENKT